MLKDKKRMSNKIFDQTGWGQASTFFFKRTAFKHEKEVRIIYNSQKNTDDFYKINIDPFDLFDNIVFDPRMKEEDFDKVISINLKGTFNLTKLVTPYMMKRREGRIVSISSVVGVMGNAGQSNYAASKAGIIGFTKSVAKELASRNILANCVAPGFIATDMTAVLNDKVKESINAQIPLKRMGTAEEIANAVYFLGGEENTYITGQTLNIDGGMI